MTSRPWLTRLVTAVLSTPPGDGLLALTEIIAAAADCDGAILWEDAADAGPATSSPMVIAAWPRFQGSGAPAPVRVPDPITLTALRDRSLALPTGCDVHVEGTAVPVAAALPLDYWNGSLGALTLLRDGDLGGDAFENVADLLEVVPLLCHALRDRHALDLAHACSRICDLADLESPAEPLPRQRFTEIVREVCDVVAHSLGCADVRVHLQEPQAADGRYPLVATSDGASVPVEDVLAEDPVVAVVIERRAALVLPDGEKTAMAAPIVSGEHLWGAIRCSDTYAPTFGFTASDLFLLEPVTTQLALLWSNWNNRRTIFAENASWRHLAQGITDLNRLIRAECDRPLPRDDEVHQTALSVLGAVVPECSDGLVDLGDVSRASVESRVAVPLTEFDPARPASVSDDRGAPASAGSGSTRPRWRVDSPMQIGTEAYGTLVAFGDSAVLPMHAQQVCTVVADQLALYHHLKRSLAESRDARQKLKRAMRSQAEALEDLQHQLVSPLLAATVRTERVLQRGRFDSRTEQQLRAVRGLCRKASRVAMQAGIFATLSKNDMPRPRTDLFGVDQLLRTLIAAADDVQQLLSPSRKIRFVVNRDSVRSMGRALVEIDQSFFEQCLSNVLDNAAKYSYDSTEVELAGACTHGELQLLVANTGLPIKPEDVQRCLERNWRGAEARSTTGEGSGLGLWIVDNLLRAMGGRLTIEPDEHRTRVVLHFPLR
jgi:signal transduction histidine kinase